MTAHFIALGHRRNGCSDGSDWAPPPLDVPGDLSVFGFDDTALARTILPTFHRSPTRGDNGEAMAEMLMIAARRRRSGLTPDFERRLSADEIIALASDGPPRLT